MIIQYDLYSQENGYGQQGFVSIRDNNQKLLNFQIRYVTFVEVHLGGLRNVNHTKQTNKKTCAYIYLNMFFKR